MNWPFVYIETFEETFSYDTFQTSQINYIAIIYQLYINYISIIYSYGTFQTNQINYTWYSEEKKHVKLPYSAIYDFKDSVSEVIEKVHLHVIEMFMMSSDHMQ